MPRKNMGGLQVKGTGKFIPVHEAWWKKPGLGTPPPKKQRPKKRAQLNVPNEGRCRDQW